jgi:cyclase
MLTKRIIPCLDVKKGRVVKGINFHNIKDAGDPIKMASWYTKQGADELIFLDISATYEKRKVFINIIEKIACEINIPFTVGGGISSEEDVKILLNSGADKISINTAAFKNPKILDKISNKFGNQCLVLAVDVKFEFNEWWVYINGGRTKTNKIATSWIKESIKRGIGEILLTSINFDGTKKGFDIKIINKVSQKFHVPIIASGGAGKMEDFYNVFKNGKADAALAASIFHYKKIKIPNLKHYLKYNGISVRI